jgi:hypothetical protein
LEPTLKSVAKRRNEYLAHLDASTILFPGALSTTAKLTLDELEEIFDETGRILNDVSYLVSDLSSDFTMIGWDDYEHALHLIADAKCAQVRQYEAEFKEKAPFPRPRGCE